MAANDPSYFQSSPLKQEMQQKELRFHLYMFQHYDLCDDRRNQRFIITDQGPGFRNFFGQTVVQDWIIRDGRSHEANIVAHAQGLHVGAAMDEEHWFICFNIVFTDERFKASSLKVLGSLRFRNNGHHQWAIIGGTGEFAYAQGVVNYTELEHSPKIVIWELHINALCLTSPKPAPDVTKIGPWGGNGGGEFDMQESISQRLESVTIRSGVVINSIAFSYVDIAGKKQSVGPWGGDGELTDTIRFSPLEIVKEVSGTTDTFSGDTVVTSLTFITNVRTYGPFGRTNGNAFSVPLMDTSVVGFFVRAGRLVNALGVYAHPSLQN